MHSFFVFIHVRQLIGVATILVDAYCEGILATYLQRFVFEKKNDQKQSTQKKKKKETIREGAFFPSLKHRARPLDVWMQASVRQAKINT